MRNRKFAGAGLQINCVDYGGEGRTPLLFIHGGSAFGHWWDFVAPHFTDRFHTLAMDLRGHGESDWSPSGDYSMEAYAADVAAMVESWGLGDPVLVGHSRGGLVGLTYSASPQARTRALAIVDSLPQSGEELISWTQSMKTWRPRRYATLEEACANFRLLPAETHATAAMLKQIAQFAYRQEDGAWVVRIDPRCRGRDPINVFDYLPAVRCPVLVARAGLSPMISDEVGRKMAAAARHGTIVEIENAYHHAMLDNPDALVRELKRFLAGLE
jgi:esterase